MFDDVKSQILISKKFNFWPILTVGTIKKLNTFFRESLVIELEWENIIEHSIVENYSTPLEKYLY